MLKKKKKHQKKNMYVSYCILSGKHKAWSICGHTDDEDINPSTEALVLGRFESPSTVANIAACLPLF